MCLAVPAKILSLQGKENALANVLGVEREIAIELVPGVTPGDYVLLHAGFAIEILRPEFAEESIRLIRKFPEINTAGCDMREN